jgi:protein-disulfide isomerase
MRFSQSCLGLGLSVAMMALSGNAYAQSDSTVVAEVGGVKLTAADLDRQESSKLLQARNTYYQAESKALDDLIDKTLLEQKAKSENLTLDQLVARDIKSQVKDPTEDQMEVYYEGLGTDQPYSAVRDRILDKIRQIRTEKARAAYVATLREKSNVFITLAPPSANVDLANVTTLGPKEAPVMVVEFADYECPYCQKVASDITKLQGEFGGKVAVAYKDFPLPMHAHAEKAAEAVRCAGMQGKFWEMHDQLFKSRDLDVGQLKTQAHALNLDSAQFDKCLDSGEATQLVQKDRQEGVQLGLTGTPSFFVNGHFFSGALDYNTLHQIVEQQLAQPTKQTAVTAQK